MNSPITSSNKMGDNNHSADDCWKKEAKELQQNMYHSLGNREWHEIKKGRLTILQQKVGYGVFGAPTEEPTEENKFTGYEKDKLIIIENICDKLDELNGGISQCNIYFSCIFVTGKLLSGPFALPIFRTRRKADDSSIYFVDPSCRIYSSWTDYLSNNTLPECKYCYPRDGNYFANDAGEVLVDFENKASLELSTATLNISPPNVFDIPRVHNLAVLVDNIEQGKTLALCVFQYTASSLFFENKVINWKIAVNINKEVQDVFNRAAKKLLKKHTGKLRGKEEMCGNARIIKTIEDVLFAIFKAGVSQITLTQEEKLNKIAELYHLMVHPDVSNKKVQLHKYGFKGLLNVNNQIKIHPDKYLELDSKSREDILTNTKKLEEKHVKESEFEKKMESVGKKNRLMFKCTSSRLKETLSKAFGVTDVKQIVINNKHLFSHIKSHEIKRIPVLLGPKNTIEPEFLKVTIKLCTSLKCKTVSDFYSYAEYVEGFMRESVIKLKKDFEDELAIARKNNINEKKFRSDYGMKPGEKQNVFFRNQAFNILLDETRPAEFSKMIDHFQNIREQVKEANNKLYPRFKSEIAATYHYLKHRSLHENKVLTVDEYFQIASELFGNDVYRENTTFDQEGSCKFVSFRNPKNHFFGVKVETFHGRVSISHIATVYYDKKP